MEKQLIHNENGPSHSTGPFSSKLKLRAGKDVKNVKSSGESRIDESRHLASMCDLGGIDIGSSHHSIFID
ncbi:hypothetical protein [Geobacillus stearothermophilus]|uniref:hypothetical protein n=1 Tax=Geobacillus stearothermophilus TaxID=1422 RepID=UPI00190FEDBB|nr:hypothetical protein [Geobacillus stearothermophilus]